MSFTVSRFLKRSCVHREKSQWQRYSFDDISCIISDWVVGELVCMEMEVQNEQEPHTVEACAGRNWIG